VFENIQQRWNDSGNATRATFLGGLLAIVLLAAWLVVWTTRDNYQVLFSDLDPQDAASMVGALDKLKVRYRLEDGGKSILVDKEAVYKTRLKLMGTGVDLRGTVGFEIFNNTDFGTTEFAQKINYQRALQGELARTIMDFEEVKFARVHLVMPDSGLFRKNDTRPKASISLIMKGDSQLSAQQVGGIQRLVAASVPEIDPASVTVLDQRGVALTRVREAEGESEEAGGRIESKKQVEAYITRKVAAILDRAVGAGQAIVSIDVSLTQDHVKTTREEVLPLSVRNGESEGAVVRRREVDSVSAGGADAPASRLAADGAALPARTGARAGNRTVELDYQNGRKVEQTVAVPGSIRRISVGILLPNDIAQERAAKIREVVSMAAGLVPARGDSIAIYPVEQFAAHAVAAGAALPLAAPAAIAGDGAPVQAAARNSVLVMTLWAALAAAVVLAVVVALLRSRPANGAVAASALGEAERTAALAQVRQWIELADTAKTGART
jgi:flagellar M-ring protein FliF